MEDSDQIFGIKGYRITKKTQLYLTREHKIPQAKNRTMFLQAEKRAKDPSPVSYSPDSKLLTKRYW